MGGRACGHRGVGERRRQCDCGWNAMRASLLGLGGPGPHFVGMGKRKRTIHPWQSARLKKHPHRRRPQSRHRHRLSSLRPPCPRGFTGSEPYHEVRGLVPEDRGGRGLHRCRHGALHDPHRLLYGSRSPQSPTLHLSIQPSLL
jgi:hypothetical protein